MKIPVIDIGLCTQCEGCLAVCPEAFRMNQATFLIEVVDLAEYPDECVDEAIKICPADCIVWEER
ncbi:MAG: ferredoxin [Proteobacteria bacterium]|nr:ferredoxin [Desulfobulbaceae bacterium]MBU4152583.1 ferredoxin [Pseudomonadota bacterium]